MGDTQYIDRRAASGSYRPGGHMSAGLRRAREPYRARNAFTGLVIGSFVVGVWLYSMSAVKQDNFDDVDEEARAMVRGGVKMVEGRGQSERGRTSGSANTI